MTDENTTTISDMTFGEFLAVRFLQSGEPNVPVSQTDPIAKTLVQSGTALLERQYHAGYWCFDLEADTTISSEYILLQHLLGTVDTAREQRLADYITSRQLPDGSWPLYEGGAGNISATVKAYFALKTVGHDPAAEAMQRACAWVRNNGGAERVNIFTRILLASFGQVPWSSVPAMPAEIIWLPRWWFFSLDKVSYWSRCVTIPLLLIFSHRPVQRGIQAIEDLVLEEETQTYVQPCVSPVWDTCLSLSALSEAGLRPDNEAIKSATDWLFDKQVFIRGDWIRNAPDLEGGGWAFQFENDFYPDVDDTSMVVMALLRVGAHYQPDKKKRIAQAVNWIIGMQNTDGGWGAFDIDNHHEYLNKIPFADHGAMVDPSTADLTGRCIEMLAMLGYDKSFPPIARAVKFLQQDQEPCGAWYGRWGVNYIYGTWAVLVGLGALGEDPNQPYLRKAVKWLKDIQNRDGGWGESCDSYNEPGLGGSGESTASQTAWALMGLMAMGETKSEQVDNGINYLVRNHEGAKGWKEAAFTGTGFPRVFYLRYHGYSHYFPVWALGVYARYRQGLETRQDTLVREGPVDLGVLPVLSSRYYQSRFN